MSTDTGTTPSTSNLDVVLGKIEQLLAASPAPQQMSAEALSVHVASELEKALAEQESKPEVAKARLAHLKSQIAAAKAVFDSGAKLAAVTMFKDPWQTSPGESATKGVVDVPQSTISPTTDGSNVQFMQDVMVTTEKGRELAPAFKALFAIAKAAPDAAIRKALVAKAGAEAAPVIIAKAGEAIAVLEKLAAVFGYTPEPGEGLLDCDFRWTVSDTISALQNAARTENVIAQMTGLLGGDMAKAALVGAPVAKSAPASAPVAKSAPAEDAWPLDMARATFDEKTGLLKSETEGLYWGRDGERAPTT